MQVTIKKQVWQVKEAGQKELRGRGKRSVYGKCIPEYNTILVAKNLERRALIDTVIHEVTHAVDYQLSESKVRQIAKASASVLNRLLPL